MSHPAAPKVLPDLSGFTGTEQWYKHPLSRLLYTDGIKYLAGSVGAYWLIDAIASYQHSLTAEGFQLWELVVREDSTATLTCRSDSGEPALVTQEIPYTDFPASPGESPLKLYVVDNVLMVPSEY